MRKPPFLLLAVGVILAAGAVISVLVTRRAPPRAQELSINIGALLPLTGNLAEYGQRVRRGIELAVEDAKALGCTVRVIFEDTEGVPQKGVLAANKLLNADRVRYIIGAVSSTVTLSVLPVAEARGALLISPAASSPKLSGASPLFLRNWPSDVLEARVLAEYAATALNLRRVVILYVNNDYGLGLQDQFSKSFAALGGTIVAREGYPLDSRDFRQIIAKHQPRFGNTDGYYLAGYHKDMAAATRQLREAGFKGQILGDADYGIQETLDIAGNAAEGAVYATPWYDPDSNQTAKTFAERFRTLYGRAPSEFEANGYDAVILIVRGVQAKGQNPAGVAAYLRTLKDYPGAGGNLTFTDSGDVIKAIAIMKVEHGEFKRISVRVSAHQL
ncbi:MAG: ABC transporter substrate-binding protein [Acidobacteriota bacterium]